MTISADLQKLYSTAPADKYYMEGISLYHSELISPVHVTNASTSFLGELEPGAQPAKFFCLPFTIKLPDKDTTGTQALNITFSNVQHDLIGDIEMMASKPYEAVICRYRIYIRGEESTVGGQLAHTQQLTPAWKLDISTFLVTRTAIVAVAAKTNLHNRPFPSVLYTAENFPGLQR